MARAKARAMARAKASARGGARTSLELGLGLVRVSCIIKKWFKQNSAAMCRCPSGICTGRENFLSSISIVPGQSLTSCRFCSIILPVPAAGYLGTFFRRRQPAL